jgi:predicted patatin/cPLA2 family phospholipase
MLLQGKKTLVLEGGGFKTSFSTGILDAFRMTEFDEFDAYLGVSGGALALSYFLSRQFGIYYKSMTALCKDPRFIQFSKAFTDGIMNLDFFLEFTEKDFAFDLDTAISNLVNKEFFMVLTHCEDGKTVYFQPTRETWMDATIATSTVPLLTKGKHLIGGVSYADGGITDPIPIKWVVDQGATDIVLIRTTHQGFKPSIFRPDFIAAQFIRDNEHIKHAIEHYQQKLKDSIDFAEQGINGVIIKQLVPEIPLKTNIFTNSVQSIISDYRYGLEVGLNFVYESRKVKTV